MDSAQQMRPNALILLIILSLTVVAGSAAYAGEDYSELRENIPAIGLLRFPVVPGARPFRSFVVSYDLLTQTQSPTVVLAGKNDVYYYDGQTLALLKHRGFDENEYPVISQNGRFISVISHTNDRGTGKILWKIRMESWTGARLWEMDFRPSGYLDPAPDGGLIVYSTAHPREHLDWDLDPDSYPAKEPHGLLIYDNQGRQVLEGIGFEELRSSNQIGMISPDGRYFALIYRYIPEDKRRDRGVTVVREWDRACLVLYDIQERKEVWRHFFAGGDPSHLVISTGAERIACSVSTSFLEDNRDADYRFYLFDRDGHIVAEYPVTGSLRTTPPRCLVFSPDGKYLAFKEDDGRISVLRATDGEFCWAWGPPPSLLAVISFGIGNDSRVVAFGVSGTMGGNDKRYWLFRSSPDGETTERRAILDVDASKGAEIILGNHNSVVWMRIGESLHMSNWSDSEYPEGGGR